MDKQDDRSMETNLGLKKNSSRNDYEQLKASNFSAKFIRIGTWQRRSVYEGDVVAKIYYAKRKLVWEILERPLKNKIEIKWSDINAIRAIMCDNEVGTLEIELSQPPLFYFETDPKPRLHALWEQSFDFTSGQASFCRRHYVEFAPRVLDKHYERLLQNDERLFALSHRLFPSQESTFFESELSFNTYGNISGFLPQMQYEYPCPTDSTSASTNYQFEGQGRYNIQVASPINSNQVFSYPCLDYVGDPNTQVLTDIENHLLGDSQVVCSDVTRHLASVESMCSLLDLLEANPNNLNPLELNPNGQVTQNGTENSISCGFSPQPMNSSLLANVEPMCSLLDLVDRNPNDQVMQNGNENSISYGFSPQPLNSIARDSNNGVLNPNNQVMQNGTENSISYCFSPQPMNSSLDVESMCSSLLDLLDANPNNELNPLDVSPNNQVMKNGTGNSLSYGFCPQPMNSTNGDFSTWNSDPNYIEK
ncbi:uncharacterized protein Fot_50235 [Forsythia ovata]|uniref:TRF2/HOY1 PH-like domain-containing protein n=1 Tax=Forsythia ovata TaxID=205694 RepID=A0ABD1PYD2_9LAMI